MSGDTQSEAGRVEAVAAALAGILYDPAWPKGAEAATYSTPRAGLEILALMCPVLVNYRNGWFRADCFHPESVDGFFEQTAGDLGSVEYVVNHLQFDEIFYGQEKPMSLQEAQAICEVLAYGWKSWARDRYGVAIRTSIICDEDQCEVTFRSKTAQEGDN